MLYNNSKFVTFIKLLKNIHTLLKTKDNTNYKSLIYHLNKCNF